MTLCSRVGAVSHFLSIFESPRREMRDNLGERLLGVLVILDSISGSLRCLTGNPRAKTDPGGCFPYSKVVALHLIVFSRSPNQSTTTYSRRPLPSAMKMAEFPTIFRQLCTLASPYFLPRDVNHRRDPRHDRRP